MRVTKVSISLPEFDDPTVQQEVNVAKFDLSEEFSDAAINAPAGYELVMDALSADGRIHFELTDRATGNSAASFSGKPSSILGKQEIKDYLQICESYRDAVSNTPSAIEGKDMARKQIHLILAKKLHNYFHEQGFDGLLISEPKEPGEYAPEHRVARRLATLITAIYVAQHTANVTEYKNAPPAESPSEPLGAVG